MGRKAIGVWCLGFRGLGFIMFRSFGVVGLRRPANGVLRSMRFGIGVKCLGVWVWIL